MNMRNPMYLSVATALLASLALAGCEPEYADDDVEAAAVTEPADAMPAADAMAAIDPMDDPTVAGDAMAGADDAMPLADWDYDALDENGFSAEEFLDAEVYDIEGDEIGEVEDLVVAGGGGRITGLVIETGGFLDIGDTHLVYPFDKAEMTNIDSVRVAIDGENVEEFGLFVNIEGEPIPGNEWRVSEFIGDYAYADGAGYGWIEDVVIDKTGNILAVVVDPDVTFDVDGYYAWPYDTGYYDPAVGVYDVPYTMDEIGGLEPFDYDNL